MAFIKNLFVVVGDRIKKAKHKAVGGAVEIYKNMEAEANLIEERKSNEKRAELLAQAERAIMEATPQKKPPETDFELKRIIGMCQEYLNGKGYSLKENGSGWVVIEPAGGRKKLETIDELEEYVRSR